MSKVNKCYAGSIGHCSSTMTGEHYISKALLEYLGDIQVEGFPWATSKKSVGIGSLQSRILCSYHNNSLSRLDSKILEIFKKIQEVTNTSSRTSYRNVQMNVDGLVLEKWMLKTFCGLIASKSFTKKGSRLDTSIPMGWLRILFHEEKFKEKTGLFLHARVKDTINTTDKLSVSPLLNTQTNQIIACKFDFRGLPFLLAMEDIENTKDYIYHIQDIRIRNKSNKDKIKFHWK